MVCLTIVKSVLVLASSPTKADDLVVFEPVSAEIPGVRILGLMGCCPLQSRVRHEATGQTHGC